MGLNNRTLVSDASWGRYGVTETDQKTVLVTNKTQWLQHADINLAICNSFIYISDWSF